MNKVIRGVFGKNALSSQKRKAIREADALLDDFVVTGEIQTDHEPRIVLDPSRDYDGKIPDVQDLSVSEQQRAIVQSVTFYPDDRPWHFPVLMKKGDALFSLGKFDKARLYFLRACAMAPKGNTAAFSKCGQEFLRIEQYDTAELFFRRAYEEQQAQNIQDVEVLYNLGLCLMAQSSPQRTKGRATPGEDEAIAMFTRVIESRPGFVEVHCRLAELQMRKGEYGQAAFHIRQAIEHARLSNQPAMEREAEIIGKKLEAKTAEIGVLAL